MCVFRILMVERVPVVPSSVCAFAAIQGYPATTRSCNRFLCPDIVALWHVGPWGSCTIPPSVATTCGTVSGNLTRTVTCESSAGAALALSLCAATGVSQPADTTSCQTTNPCACTSNAQCGAGHRTCDPVTHDCTCAEGWSGSDCNIALLQGTTPCPDGIIDAVGACCTGFVDSRTGVCCPRGVDRFGFCCASGVVDACGVCDGHGVAMDAQGVCCPTALPPSGLCCSAGLDSCGVCGGENVCKYVGTRAL